jgi:hypothetical protein
MSGGLFFVARKQEQLPRLDQSEQWMLAIKGLQSAGELELRPIPWREAHRINPGSSIPSPPHLRRTGGWFANW